MDPAVEKLLGILRAHKLPNKINIIDSTSRSTYRMTENSIRENLRNTDQLGRSQTLYSDLHRTIHQATQYMPILTSVDNAVERLITKMDYVIEAANEAAFLPRRAEGGLTSYLMGYLFDPLNALLGRLMPFLPGRLIWQDQYICRSKPDFRLIWAYHDGKTEREVVILEMKTDKSLPTALLRILLQDLSSGAISVGNASVTISDPTADQSLQTKRAKLCKTMDQVRASARYRGALFAGLSNGDYLTIAEVVESPWRPQGKDFRFGDLISISGIPVEGNLVDSPLGAFLGVTLKTLEHIPVDVQTCFRDYYTHPGRSLTSSNPAQGTRNPSAETSSGHAGSSSLGTSAGPLDGGAPPTSPGFFSTSLQHADHAIGKDALPTPAMSPDSNANALKVHQDYPITVMYRWSEPFHLQPTTNGNAGRSTKTNPLVVLQGERSQGAVWAVYGVHLSNESPSNISQNTTYLLKNGLIAKVNIRELHIPFHEDEEDMPDFQESIKREYDILTGPLASLQGDVVPRLYGLWKSQSGTCLCLMEDAGQPFSNGDMQDREMLAKVRSAVQRIFDAGVAHDDLEWRHVFRSGDNVKIIDFDNAHLRGDETQEQWNDLAAYQISCLLES